MKKPERLKFEHLKYLDNLNVDGEFNIFSSFITFVHIFPAPSEEESKQIVQYWLKTYNERHGVFTEKEHDILSKIYPTSFGNKIFQVMNEYPTLNYKEACKIAQYWLKNFKVYKEKDEDDIEEEDNNLVKILAISFGNKIFRVVIELHKSEEDNVAEIFKSYIHTEFCDLIYNFNDRIILKCKNASTVSHKTINSIFGYLPLITMDEFTKEIINWRNEKKEN